MKRRLLLAAALTIASAARAVPTAAEQARIERLIDAVAQQRDAQFVRNGKPSPPADAATFLRARLKAIDGARP